MQARTDYRKCGRFNKWNDPRGVKVSRNDTLPLAKVAQTGSSNSAVTHAKKTATTITPTTTARTFIDEVNITFPFSGNIPSSTQRVIDGDGVVIHEGQNRVLISGRYNVTPVRIRTFNRKDMAIQVCVPKYIFGHNAAGYLGFQRSTRRVLDAVGQIVRRKFEEPWTEPKKRDVKVRGVSLVRHMALETEDAASRAINEIQLTCAANGLHILFYKAGETVTVSTNPRQYSFTFYVKGKELRSNQAASRHPDFKNILEIVTGWVRVEIRIPPITIRRLGLETAADWKPSTTDAVFEDIFSALSFLSLCPVTVARSVIYSDLPLPLQRAVALVRAGESLAESYSPSSVRRLSAQAAEYGLDLRTPASAAPVSAHSLNPAKRWVLDVPDSAKRIQGFDVQYGNPADPVDS